MPGRGANINHNAKSYKVAQILGGAVFILLSCLIRLRVAKTAGTSTSYHTNRHEVAFILSCTVACQQRG